MFETVYGIFKKKAIVKDENNLKVFVQDIHAYGGSSTPLIFATRKAATAKLETYYENIRNDYKVVRLEFSFPNGYFKVSTSPEPMGGNVNGVGVKFAHLGDAITVATGISGWKDDANIYFVGESREQVFVSVAEWKAYQAYKSPKKTEMYLLRNSNGTLIMNSPEDTKKMLDMITLV
jgi:hypothetical protein